MATKVGGFTKNGVVQCVKLVEEEPTDLSPTFSGTISGSGINLDNGYRLQFKSGSSWSTAVDKTTFPSNMRSLNLTIQNADFSVYAIWFNRDSVSGNRFTASFNTDSYEGRASIVWKDKDPIKMYFNELIISDDGAGGYDKSYFVFNQTYLAMYNRENELVFYYTFTGSSMDSIYGSWETPGSIPYSDRFKNPTVRMCKDGTLKCSKLIEESNYDISRFSGSLVNGTVVYDNGITLEVTSATGIHKDIYGGETIQINVTPEDQTTSPTALLRSSISTSEKITSTISNNELYTNAVNLKMSSIIITNTTGIRFITGDRLVVNYSGGTYTYTNSSAASIQITFVTSDSSPAHISQKDRTLPATVRALKDGTIKCSKIEEATIESKLSQFDGTATLPPSSGVITCNNGLKISIGAYSLPGGSSDDYSFIFKDENYVKVFSLNRETNPSVIKAFQSYSSTSDAELAKRLWEDNKDIVISEIQIDYLETTTLPNSITITKQDKSYNYTLYPSSSNPYTKNYRPSGEPLILTIFDRLNFTWPATTPI